MSYQALFYPKNIAIIGASRKVKTVGNDIVKNLVTQGFAGGIFPVNPNAENLYGKTVYASVADIPSEIDLVIVCVPAKFVTQVVTEAHEKGAQAAIVISAGCKEIGNIELERELTKICQKKNMSLVGPNCLGIINPEIKMNASFASVMPKPGNVAFVSQSGALCTAVLDYAQDLGIGFSKFMSIGNKADINELKLLRYFAEDEHTKVIALYVEQLENAPELIDAVKSISTGPKAKPVIMLKSGRTTEGSSAIASHTGSLSGGDAAYTALFNQAGIIRAESVSDMFDYIQIFSKNELQPVKNVAIVTNAGGPGVLTTDELVNAGLRLAPISKKSIEALEEFLPAAASTHNPVDILGDAVGERYQKTLEVLVKDDGIDAILVLLTPQSMTEIRKTAHAVVHAHYYGNKPIVASFMGQETVHPGVQIMREAGVVTTMFPEQAAHALGVFAKFATFAQKKETRFLNFKDVDKAAVSKIFAEAKKTGKTSFPEVEALHILQAYNFPLLQSTFAKDAQTAEREAKKMAKKLGSETTFAIKIVSQDILHKSDVGGVRLGLTEKNIAAETTEMLKVVAQNAPKAKLDGVLVMEMAPKNGIETILGVSKAPGLGTMIMFGLGGIYVEVLKDVAFSFVPLTKADASRMITSLKSAELFKGVRGAQPSDIETVIECIGRLGQLISDFPEIVELDINPLLALPAGKGAKVLDARVVIE